jgi:hypothetical protein
MAHDDDLLQDQLAPLIQMRDITAPHVAPPTPVAESNAPGEALLPAAPDDDPFEAMPEPVAPEIDRSGCPTAEGLADVLKRTGGEAERMRTVEHLRECQACRAEMNAMRASAMARSTPPATSRFHNYALDRRTLLVSGGVTVALVTLILVLRSHSTSDRADSARPVATLAVASAPSAAATRTTRSSGQPDVIRPPLELIAPAVAERVARPIVLTWHDVPTALRYHVEMLDQGNWSAYSVTTEDTSITIPPKTRLRPGRSYRWWVQATLEDGTHQRSAPRVIKIR